MKRFYFDLTLSGIGETPEDAWENALEGFVQDPGEAPEPSEEEEEEDD